MFLSLIVMVQLYTAVILTFCTISAYLQGTVATVNAAITHSVQHERSTEAHAALESVIFTALQQKIFQRPVTLAICLQTLAHLQYRRNDSSGALTLSANVYQLRQVRFHVLMDGSAYEVTSMTYA